MPHPLRVEEYYTLSSLNDFGNYFEVNESESCKSTPIHLRITSSMNQKHLIGYEYQCRFARGAI
jgi:hypothetical protein